MPHPNFVPLRSRTSRSTQSSGMSGATSTVVDFPLTLNVNVMWLWGQIRFSVRSQRRPIEVGSDSNFGFERLDAVGRLRNSSLTPLTVPNSVLLLHVSLQRARADFRSINVA